MPGEALKKPEEQQPTWKPLAGMEVSKISDFLRANKLNISPAEIGPILNLRSQSISAKEFEGKMVNYLSNKINDPANVAFRERLTKDGVAKINEKVTEMKYQPKFDSVDGDIATLNIQIHMADAQSTKDMGNCQGAIANLNTKIKELEKLEGLTGPLKAQIASFQQQLADAQDKVNVKAGYTDMPANQLQQELAKWQARTEMPKNSKAAGAEENQRDAVMRVRMINGEMEKRAEFIENLSAVSGAVEVRTLASKGDITRLKATALKEFDQDVKKLRTMVEEMEAHKTRYTTAQLDEVTESRGILKDGEKLQSSSDKRLASSK